MNRVWRIIEDKNDQFLDYLLLDMRIQGFAIIGLIGHLLFLVIIDDTIVDSGFCLIGRISAREALKAHRLVGELATFGAIASITHKLMLVFTALNLRNLLSE